MEKRWYPVAVSALIVGCGGDVDSGSPAATGGRVSVDYGVGILNGGSTGIDTGKPTETGGLALVAYGPIGFVSTTGGSSGSLGGTTSLGGTAAAGGSTSTVDVRACLADSDCTQCVYITAPSNSSECPNALGCCGGQVMNQETCNWNQGAWDANCAGQGYTAPICPCISLANSTLSCKNGECGFY